MNCDEFERQFAELEDTSGATPEIELHQHACVLCSELAKDLRYIQRQAREMVPVAQPDGRVWQQIRMQLHQAGMIAESPRRRFLPAAAFGWFPRLSMGLAYAAVFFVALGVVRVYSIFAVPVSTPPLPPAPNPPFAQLFEKVPPEKRAVYVSNLNQVDSSIQQLRTFLAVHPDDPFARRELFTTYQQKSRLWEALVKWQEF